MAVNYVAQKCTSCAGTKLEYIKDMKAWRCLYCGTLIERREQADTMFTIKNVVRQALLDVAYARTDSAQRNLVECEKIDSRYIGTLIAEIAYEMNMLISSDISPGEQSNMLALLKKNYTSLKAAGDAPTDEETALYDFLDSSEIIGLLILVYDSLGAEKRRDFIYRYFNASEVYSPKLNGDLLNYTLKTRNFEAFGKIAENTANIDAKQALALILEKYPDGEKKRELAVKLASLGGTLSEDDVKAAEAYLETTSDSIETKCGIAAAFLSTPARPSVECLMKNIITEITDESNITQIFDALTKKQLRDTEIYTIIDYAISDCSDSICGYILRKFRETNQFVEFSYNRFLAVLSRPSSAETKKQLIAECLSFSVSEKTKEAFVSSYLCGAEDSEENRKTLIPYLLSLVETLSAGNTEKYLLRCGTDKEFKADVVKMIFGKKINRSFFHNTLSNYVKYSDDPVNVKKEIISALISAGLGMSTDAALTFLCNNTFGADDRITVLRQLKSAGINRGEIADLYLTSVSISDFNTHIFAELIADATAVTSRALVRYILDIPDSEAAKASRTAKMCGLCYDDISNIRCSVRHNGNTVICSAVQGYILAARESEEAAVSILAVLCGRCSNINSEIEASGARMKFKKYINSQKNYLDGKVKRMCAEAGIL